MPPTSSNSPNSPHSQSPALLHELSQRDAIAIVAGTVIGSGIFLVPSAVATQLPPFAYVLLAWVVGGLLSLFGALALGELGAAYPGAGGLYVYLREAYGRPVGFLYGWGLLSLIQSGSIATLAVAFRIYLGQFIALTVIQEKIAGFVCVLVLTAVNCFGVRSGKLVQNIFFIAKLGGLALMIWLLFQRGHVHLLASSFKSNSTNAFHPAAFGIALVAVLWAYEGWHVVSFTAGEFKNPQRDLPRGLFYGTLIVAAVYILANLGYYCVLTPSQIEQTQRVAATAIAAIAGGPAASFISALILVSILGAINGMTLTGPRVYYAMAKEGLFFKAFEKIEPRSHAPVIAIIIQGVWAACLTLLGSFQELFTYVVFTAWIFYGLAVLAVIVLRVRHPNVPRPFRVPLYPWLVILFAVAALGITLNTFIATPTHALIGIGLILIGLPIYAIFVSRNRGVNTKSAA